MYKYQKKAQAIAHVANQAPEDEEEGRALRANATGQLSGSKPANAIPNSRRKIICGAGVDSPDTSRAIGGSDRM
jgi:casein kinase I family protein HRR25